MVDGSYQNSYSYDTAKQKYSAVSEQEKLQKMVDAETNFAYSYNTATNAPNSAERGIMDKGIRPEARAKFVELNEKRRRGEAPYTGPKANTVFRKAVMSHLMENFTISLASAATHYNEAFKLVKEATPELVSGLGRTDDKKGGRKPKAKTEAPAAAAPVVETPKVVLYTVKKKKDGSVVAADLTQEAAEELVAKAKAAKKSALEAAPQE